MAATMKIILLAILAVVSCASTFAAYDNEFSSARQAYYKRKLDKARAGFLKLAKEAPNAKAKAECLSWAVDCLLKQKQYDEAETLAKTIEISEMKGQKLLDVAVDLAWQAKKPEQAMALVESIDVKPLSIIGRIRLLNMRRQSKEAVAQYGEEPIADWPVEFQAEGFYRRARAFVRAGSHQRAASDYEKASEQARGRFKTQILQELGDTYANYLKDDSKALDAYDRAIANKGANSYYRSILGKVSVLTRQKRYDEALKLVEKLVNGRGTWKFRGVRTRGDVLLAKGDEVEALKAYMDAMKVIGAPSREVKALKKHVGELSLSGKDDDSIVLAFNGSTNCQIILPDQTPDENIRICLEVAARLLGAAFKANGCEPPIVKEKDAAPDKPGVYLGATKFARQNGVDASTFEDWEYQWKAANGNVIIAGLDKSPETLDFESATSPRSSLGTVKGVADFARRYAGVRFVFPDLPPGVPFQSLSKVDLSHSPAYQFLKTPLIAAPSSLNIRKKPALAFNFAVPCSTGFHAIANNLFPPAPGWSEKTLAKDSTRRLPFWNSGLLGPYIPKRTPLFIDREVKKLLASDAKGNVFQEPGSLYGLEGPVYYCFGRMLGTPDVPPLEWMNEYHAAAYGKASGPMKRFHDRLYHAIELHSLYLGAGGRAETYQDSQGVERRHLADPFRLIGFLFTPSVIEALDKDLRQAEKVAEDANVRSRLALVRREFEFIKHLSKIVHFHQAYLISPDAVALDRLLEAIDERDAWIASLYDPTGKPLPIDGMEFTPFPPPGHEQRRLRMNGSDDAFAETPLGWNTSEKRANPHSP